MAGFFQAGLQPTNKDGLSLKDYRHAAKIFGSAGFQNAPKFKWLFHVYFEINREFLSNGQFGFPPDYLPGLLVKNINLPKYSIAVSEMNQYNRKRYIQTKLTYDAITVTFHDDNGGTIRDLWYKYFSYYYNDASAPLGSTDIDSTIAELNRKNTYAPSIKGNERWGYNANTTDTEAAINAGIIKAPFFKSIKVYGFNQHSFALYELINPLIERFEHDTYDYSQGSGVMENRMTIRYETVKYQQGALDGQDPGNVVRGFGRDGDYDKVNSPIMVPGANSEILGTAGMVDANNGFVSDLKELYRNAGEPNSIQSPVKNPQSNFNGSQKKLIDGAVNASTNPDTTRSQFNMPSSASVNGPTAQDGQSNNWPRKSAPSIPTPANNPIV
jgi:hypothetical protein